MYCLRSTECTHMYSMYALKSCQYRLRHPRSCLLCFFGNPYISPFKFCYNEVSYTTNIVHIYMFIHIHVCIIACDFVDILYDYAYHIMYLLFYSVQIPGLNQATTEAVPAPQLSVPDNPTPLAPSSSSPSSAECYLSKEQTVQLWTQIQQVHAYSYVHVYIIMLMNED